MARRERDDGPARERERGAGDARDRSTRGGRGGRDMRGARRPARPHARGRGARRPPASAARARSGAEARLRRFRQGSILAVGVTALFLLLLGEPAPGAGATPAASTGAAPAAAAQDAPAAGTAGAADPVADPGQPAAPEASEAPEDTVAPDPGEAAREAAGTLRRIALDLYGMLPAVGLALLLLVVAAVLARLVGMGLRLALASWERAQATAALVSVFIWLVAIGTALSVVAGDARALVGSVGLFGLALSWALQAPIESFTGWLLNSFRSYYRVGDRIAVGEVFGDVARIDFLTTTVFEAGGPDKRVQAAQSTGALVTFPNLEVLRSNIVNYTRDFPYVWDEITVAVANESDLALAVQVLEETAAGVVGDAMDDAAAHYARLLAATRLDWDVATRPQVFAASRDSWTDLTIRYLVPARQMRLWSSRLLLALNEALDRPDVAQRVFTAYPRTLTQALPTPRWARRDRGEDEPGGE